jgi:predicted nucleic acid-binding protein
MRVVLDTNILVSALISPVGRPAAIYSAWEDGRFTLLTCAEHLDEVRATLQKPRVAETHQAVSGWTIGEPNQGTR